MSQNFEEDYDDKCNIAKPCMKGLGSCPSGTGWVKPRGQLGSDHMPESEVFVLKL